MKSSFIHTILVLGVSVILLNGCAALKFTVRSENKNMPASFNHSSDTNNIAHLSWRDYFADPNLVQLIDVALKNNQELNIVMQEIAISQNEIRARRGEYLPFVNLGLASGMEKEGRYTRFGAVDEQLNIAEGRPFPTPLRDFMVGGSMRWEVDIWQKLRNARKSSVMSYLATVEGKKFMETKLVAEIAESYYELLALDNLLAIIDQNIEIQSNALRVVKQQKESAKVSQLAVNRFEAQLLNTENLQFAVRQKIVETENRINFLTARYPGPIPRNSSNFLSIDVQVLQGGIPVQLLDNRPDIKQAELQLEACKLDVKVAKANFYPSLGIRANLGFRAFNPAFLINPESILYNMAGDALAPLVNRNAIKAIYYSANAKQLQAVFNYEETILNAYLDVMNQLSKIDNYSKSYDKKRQEVEILNQSILIANNLFNSARADYAEVLLTQREALEAKLELIEIKINLLHGKVNVYRALGGGWR